MPPAFAIEERYMKRCLQLAENGRQYAAPNPVVGAVIVHDNTIIGEGYHTACGEPHAEVNAIASVKDDTLLEKSTMYVSLEPCSHYGKTPPCAELIIKKRIPRVVIGMRDPFPQVSGQGIALLESAGIETYTGLLEEECHEINNRFITFHTGKRPYIILKWAQTSDGYIDRERKGGKPLIISNEVTQLYVHKLRSTVGGILIGTNTALKDNPSLTTRLWNGRNPVRLVIDRNLRIPESFSLLNDGQAKTIVFTALHNVSGNENVQYETLDFSTDILPQLLDYLYATGIQSVLVEGGRYLLQRFAAAGLWDEARIEIAEMRLGSGIPAPLLNGEVVEIRKCGTSSCITLRKGKMKENRCKCLV